MSSSDSNDLEIRVSRLEKKLDLIAKSLNVKFDDPQPTPPISTPQTMDKTPMSAVDKTRLNPNIYPTQKLNVNIKNTPITTGKLLGYAGAACLILAVILLIRLSIDSGWLTPERQLILAALMGATFIALPFIKRFKDIEYMSQLPAAGIVILHLTVMGGVYFHKIIEPTSALFLISGVGVLSLALVSIFKFESYAVLSIVGTYVGAITLKSGFPSRLAFIGFISVWNIVYSYFSIFLKNRKIIILTSYLAIGLVSLKVVGLHYSPDEYLKVAVVQAFQFLIFFSAVVIFTLKNKTPLTYQESWSFFPLILFFYFLEYHLLDRVMDHYATAMALFFSLGIFAVYKHAKKGLTQTSLASGEMIYTTLATIFAHAIYLSVFNEITQVIFGFFMALLLGFYYKRIASKESFKGALLVLALVFGHSILQVLVGSKSLPFNLLILMGFLYGLCALIFYLLDMQKHSKTVSEMSASLLILLLAHSQILLSIYRLKEFISRSLIAPLWIAYAFILFIWAFKTKTEEIAKSALPIILLGLLRFMVVDFSRLEGGERIISLLVMGALIFAAGYTYRKISFGNQRTT